MKQSEIKNIIRYSLSAQNHLKIVNDDFGVWWDSKTNQWESYENTCDPLGAVLLTKQVVPLKSELAPHGFGAYRADLIARFFEKPYEYIRDFMDAFQFGLGFDVKKFPSTLEFMNKEIHSEGTEAGIYFYYRIFK